MGAKVDIETLDGNIVSLKIPEGTQNGDILKLRGKGMPFLQGRGYGDLYVEVGVQTPKRLSRKAKKLLEELKDELRD